MTDRELQQIEALLSGEHRYKLFDCERVDVLKLKGARLQVWLTMWANERHGQESWLKNATIMSLTGLSEPTVIAAKKWLVANGWLRPTGETAADKYARASRGSRKIMVYGVDSPKSEAKVSLALEQETKETLASTKNVLPQKTLDKVNVPCSCSPSSYESILALSLDKSAQGQGDDASLFLRLGL